MIEFNDVTKGYNNILLIDHLTLSIPPGSIVGIIGPNGAGKTTLLKMITGEILPDKGSVRIGQTVQLAYIDQSRETLNGENTVWQEISAGQEILTLGNRQVNSRAYVSSFNFLGSDQQKNVSSLSGGERNRVHTAKMLTQGANVLLFDEPTNDLDVNTLRSLEDAIENFSGCAIIVSHDRWFLDRVATHILAFEGESEIRWFIGNYSDYESDRHQRLGINADTPRRIQYKKITR